MGLHAMTAVALMMVGCCMFLAGHAEAYTKIVSSDVHPTDKIVYVPQHEDFRLQCETQLYRHNTGSKVSKVSSEYRHRLFLKRGDEAIPVNNTNLADGCETVVNHTVTTTNDTYAFVKYLYTIFRLKAEQAGSFTYGCMLVAEDARDVMLVQSRTNLTIEICSEPHFSLNIEEGNVLSEFDRLDEGTNVVLNTDEKCHFNGAVSYLVNDVTVPRMSSGDALSPQAVENEDYSLEIHSPVCVGRQSVCNITALFTYIFEGKVETSHSFMSLNDCCIDVGTPTTPKPPKVTASSLLSQLRANNTVNADVMESIGNLKDPLVAERKQLEISKLELEIEVLKLKRELIPLQIIGRQKRIGGISGVAKKQLMVDEEDDTALPI